MHGGGNQDWDTIVIRKKPQGGGGSKTDVNAARRQGAAVETGKKYGAGGNARSATSLNTAKLDAETDELSHNRVSTDLKKAIMQARLDKKLTQAQLGQMINEKPQIIQEYENGKAIPNQQVIGKMERALGVKLRGKKK